MTYVLLTRISPGSISYHCFICNYAYNQASYLFGQVEYNATEELA